MRGTLPTAVGLSLLALAGLGVGLAWLLWTVNVAVSLSFYALSAVAGTVGFLHIVFREEM